ncbi:MAG: Cof-type HAD-IIB family hydrolase [Anaerolineae bacterium]|nr:Cof-type HAD-IIB family hydrolase [Anaerolineae bacterium]
MKPIFCFDLDGTLVNEQGNIHPNDINLLADPQLPVQLIAATGRSLDSVQATFHKNGLFLDQNIPFPLLLLNGAVTCHSSEIISSYISFRPDLQKQLVSLSREQKQIAFLFLAVNEINILNPNPFGLASAAKYEFPLRTYDFDSGLNSFCKVMCLSEHPEDLIKMNDAVKALPVSTAYSMPTIFEISPPGVNKGSALLALLTDLDRQNTPLYTAGDGENDLELLKLARLSFAPLTALPAVKLAATNVIDTASDGLITPMLRAAGII